MSQDRGDFARQIQRRQFGLDPAFFGIVIDPNSGGANGGQMQLGQSYPVNMNPCDGLWLPRCYDASLGCNPAQARMIPGTGSQTNYITGGTAEGLDPIDAPTFQAWGVNAWDLYDAETAQGVNFYGNGAPVQLAAIFALQFNSPNSPWFVWSLSDFLVPDTWLPNGAANPTGCLVGSGDAMRSISGPISSMSVKFLRWAASWNTAADRAEYDIPASRIVLLSSLGFSQQTRGASQPGYASGGVGNAGGGATFQPQCETSPSQVGVDSGGYVQTNLNTLEVLELEKRGIIGSGSLR